MERRTIYTVGEYYQVFAKDDVEKTDAIDTNWDYIGTFKTQERAEAFAKKYSAENKLEYPLFVEERREYRNPPPLGKMYKEGMGWFLGDDDDDTNENNPKRLSDWWEGKLEDQ